ncbi:hypothetical protein ACFOWX_03985 [Sphingorhabdus arenilitoris]|uniref:Secreted protein n=1 Tax=Sphingorhabdus arenilitoris TaxID=1490041 RepID=A0ABV8RED2_9SPHN
MKMVKKIAASVAVCALAAGAPAFAQQAQDNDNDTTGAAGDNSDTIVVNDLLDIYLQAQTDNSQDNSLTANDVGSNNNTVSANQLLNAVNTNSQMDELVDLDGEDGTPAPVGYNSGNNEVRGSAFAAFAGILNQAWNTGINSNAQAATNIAAQGTINFGDGSSAAGAGGGGGGGD